MHGQPHRVDLAGSIFRRALDTWPSASQGRGLGCRLRRLGGRLFLLLDSSLRLSWKIKAHGRQGICRTSLACLLDGWP